MKKRIQIISLIILIYVVIRMLFFYTIVEVPCIFGIGTETYAEGNGKYDYPICLVNPIKVNKIKKKIIYYLQNEYVHEEQNTSEYYQANIYWFFDDLDNIADFDIISANVTEPYSNNCNERGFLLQSKKNPPKKCVVFISKETNKIVRFGF